MNKLALHDYVLKADLGQVWTPEQTADRMSVIAKEILKKYKYQKLSILDPAVGPATFPKALIKNGLPVESIDCYDIDPEMSSITQDFLLRFVNNHEIKNCDYLLEDNCKKYDLIILNPPYVRHENFDLGYKGKVRRLLSSRGIKNINGRSNIFVYFLYKCLTELNRDGVVCAIVYDSITYSQYGKEFWNYVETKYCVDHIEQIRAPFKDTLIDASIVVIRKSKNTDSRGRKNLCNPVPNLQDGMTYLSDLLNISRGTTFPSRKIFISSREDDYYHLSKPIVMKPRDRRSLVVDDGDSKAYFYGLDAELDSYLDRKLQEAGVNKQKTTKKKGNILLNYYIRSEARHLYNRHNLIVSDNFYVSSAKNGFPDELAWLLLNSNLYKTTIINFARNQGNGLKKLQAYEYKSAIVPDWKNIRKGKIEYFANLARTLIDQKATISLIQQGAEEAINELF